MSLQRSSSIFICQKRMEWVGLPGIGRFQSAFGTQAERNVILAGVSLLRGSPFVPQPIIPLDLPVRVRSWELTVYPRSHIRRWLGSGSGKARGRWPFLGGPVVQAALTHYCGAISEKSRVPEVQASRSNGCSSV